MKNQLYRLLTIQLGRDKSKSSDKKAIGMVVDVESMFGKGKKIDKDKLGKAVKNYARGGTIDTKPLKDMMEQPEQVEKIVNDGFTEEKSDSKDQFNDLSKLAGTAPDEDAALTNELKFKRRTFNLASALFNAEQNYTTRHAEELKEKTDEYGRGGVFRYKRSSHKRKGRRNLLD